MSFVLGNTCRDECLIKTIARETSRDEVQIKWVKVMGGPLRAVHGKRVKISTLVVYQSPSVRGASHNRHA